MSVDRNIPPALQDVKHLALTYPENKNIAGGHPAFIVNNKDTKLVRIDLMWPLGFSGKPAYVHRAMSKLVFAGSGSYTAGDIETKLSVLGCEYGFTVYEEHAILKLTSLKSTFQQALELFLGFFNKPTFPEKEIHVLKNMESASLQSRFKTPDYWSAREITERLFEASHPKHRISEISDINSVSKESIVEAHSQYKLNQSTLFLYGDIDSRIESELSKTIAQYGSYTEIKRNSLDYRTKQVSKGLFRKHIPNTNQVVLNAAYIKTTITEDKMPLIYLLNMALGGFFGSRLMKDVREKRGLTYGIGSRVSLQNGLFHLQISSQMNSENVDSAISAIQEIITSLQKEGVKKEEFARSKRYFLGQLYRSIDEPHSMLNKVQYSLSKGKALNAFENKCLAVLNADIEDVNGLVNDLFRHSDLAWCLAGDVS